MLKKLLLISSLLLLLLQGSRAQVVDTICPGYPYASYGVNGFVNSSFVWDVKGGQLISTNGSDSVRIHWDITASAHHLSVVEVSDKGCIGDTMYAQVIIASPPQAEIYGPDSVCRDETVLLTSSFAQTYEWSTGDTSAEIMLKVRTDTLIALKVDDGCGTDSTSMFIYALPKPHASFHATPSIARTGKSVNLIASSMQNNWFYSWIVDNDTLDKHHPSVYHTFSQEGLHEIMLMVENRYHCYDTAYMLIEAREEMVNTFSPNGDGINDLWEIPELKGNNSCKVWIYDRWNGEVFYSEGYNKPWDGTHNGNDVPEGSYFYIIKYGDGSEPVKGIVNVIR